jgi:hypothetical protein
MTKRMIRGTLNYRKNNIYPTLVNEDQNNIVLTNSSVVQRLIGKKTSLN